jgi:ABC-type multidrug transport system fused ATPase/permease subunit
MNLIRDAPPDDSMTYADFVILLSVSSSGFNLGSIFFAAGFGCFILMSIFIIFLKKKLLIFAGLIGIATFALQGIAWLSGAHNFELVSNLLLIFFAFLLMLGAIMMRKESKLSIISGIILFLFVVALQGFLFMSTVMPMINAYWYEEQFQPLENVVNLYYTLVCAQYGLIAIHVLLTSFSRKRQKSEDIQDTMSVEKESAFTSYVEEKPKKQKPKQKPEEVQWKF